jgi:Rrf2 family nitric oxide-sensitive transcriptional repressor
MKLNHFTDFSLRVLIYLNQQTEDKSSLDELSKILKISRNHLIKVVQFLSAKKMIQTRRGKNGGIIISKLVKETKLGDLIHTLEQNDNPVINCEAKLCIFINHQCKLKELLNKAYFAFIASLNHYYLDDLLFDNWKEIIKT